MTNKIVQRLLVSVNTDIELTDQEIAKKKQLLKEYAKALFSAGFASVNLTYEEK